jgi:SAM-dependent methyltransferase
LLTSPLRAGLCSLLRCPFCRSELTLSLEQGRDALVCRTCSRRAPVIDGIPRFVDVPRDPVAHQTQESFGYEWTHFNDWRPSGESTFNDYFEGLALDSLAGLTVLDAGCGMGRHARQMAAHAEHVVAVDFSRAIDQAARNMQDLSNVDCVQADLFALPFADGSFDYVYSMGVLHHVADTEHALMGLVRKVRPGGRLRVYLYWKRHGWQGRLLSVVTLLRRATVMLSFPLLRVLCWFLSLGLYALIVLPYRALEALGVRRQASWPLFVYTKYPFVVLYNDQFDRFSAPIEKRYDPDEVRRLLESAGLIDVTVRACFGWVAEGTKPA